MTREEEIEELRRALSPRPKMLEHLIASHDRLVAVLKRMSEGLNCGDRGCEGVEIARATLAHLKEPAE